MSFKCGIVGLPNVGKSTLFNALTASKQAQAENFPFCTIDPNVGIVAVPDERLIEISKISKSIKTVNAAITFVDIAGLVKGGRVTFCRCCITSSIFKSTPIIFIFSTITK